MEAAWWLQNRNLSLGKRKKIAMGNENGRERVKMFFSRIKSPFCKHDFACTILPVSSRTAKWMIWWSGVGDNQSRHRVIAGAIEKVCQCRPQKLGSWCTQTCTPAAAQYRLSHSGSAACHRLLSLSSKWLSCQMSPRWYAWPSAMLQPQAIAQSPTTSHPWFTVPAPAYIQPPPWELVLS